jgi:hypothetical protein
LTRQPYGSAHTLPHSYQAGIYRETLEYWLGRSAAGYDIEWQEIEWRFHEHCASAIDQVAQSYCKSQWVLSPRPGVVSETDENGNFIVEACGQTNMKMARLIFGVAASGEVGKRRKTHVPLNAGVETFHEEMP